MIMITSEISEMASKGLQAGRFVKIINQRLETLKEERNNVKEAADDCINQMQSEVDAWVKGGAVNQTTCVEMSNRIQQATAFLIEKTFELSVQNIFENERDRDQASLTNTVTSDIPSVHETTDEAMTGTRLSRDGTVRVSDANTVHITNTRFAILEEAVLSLKKTTVQVQEKQEHVDSILKDVETHQENINKKVEILTNANLKSKKQIKKSILNLEMTSKEFSSNVDKLYETVTNVDVKLNRLEEENKSVNVSINELNKQVSSVRTCSNDALMSIQDLSKSVESTNQHYNEMSNKMNQLESSMNLMSSQYTEQFENMSSTNKDTFEECIGMICQLLNRRLTPLEKLNETLNKQVNTSEKQLSKADDIENRVAALSNKLTEIELKCCLPNVGFHVSTSWKVTRKKCCKIEPFEYVGANYGSHFEPSTGVFTAPLGGLYLISVSTESNVGGNYLIRCCQEEKDDGSDKDFCGGGSLLFNVYQNQTITRFFLMEAGNEIYLQSKSSGVESKVEVYFSCCMIKGLH